MKLQAGAASPTLLATKSNAPTTWQRDSIGFEISGTNPNSTPFTFLFDIADGTNGTPDSFGAYIDNVMLLPMEAVSRDKFLAGSFEIPSGWDSLQMEFAGPGGENLGKYGELLGGGATKIYNSVTEILNEADFNAGGQPSSQKVWFVKDPDNSRKVNFYTCFNAVGTVQIKLYLNGSTDAVGTFTHQLVAAGDFAATIAYVDAWVKGTSFNWYGAVPSPLAAAAGQAGNAGGNEIDNLTRACLIPFFNVINQVEGLGSVATGLFDGVKNGIQDDWAFLQLIGQGVVVAGDWAVQQAQAELLGWRHNPLKRAAELKQMADKLCEDLVFGPLHQLGQDFTTWEGFKRRSWQTWERIKGGATLAWTVTKISWSSVVDGLASWADDFCSRMMQGGEKAHWDSAPWVKNNLLAEVHSATRQSCYTFGYVFGYLCEQVAVGALSAGTVKVAQVAAKGGISLAANLAKRTAANVAARAHLLKRLLAEAKKLPDDLAAAYQRGFSLASTGPTGEGMLRLPMEMMQEAADAGKLVWRDYVDNIVGKTNIRQLVKEGGEGIIERRFAQLMHILGDDFTKEMGENFLKLADELILVKKADGTVDEFFEAFFRAFEGNPGLMVNADVGAVFYKRVYKKAGYDHHPTAPGFDCKSTAEYVQIKTLKNPDGALGAMKKAVDALMLVPNPPNGLTLHILKKPGSGSDQLQTSLIQYIQNHPSGKQVSLIIQEFDLVP